MSEMNDWTRDTGGAARYTGETDSGSDYRIREVEARLDRRLAVIEGQRERASWMTLLSGAGLVLTLAALAFVLRTVKPEDGAWTVDSLSAEEIVLRDADGIARGRLATDSEGRAELALSDRDGRERIRLTVLEDGSPGVTISDPDARPRAVLGYLPDGTTNLVLADGRGVSRAVFGLDADGSTQALFADRAGTIRTLVGVGADGEPSVSTFEGLTGEEGAP
jgi:hypothetical protein